LFDTQISVGNPLSPLSRFASRERQHGVAHHDIRDARVFDERCVMRREQATVEGSDLQVAGTTTGMGKTRNCLQ
jgi:hypothetical protein